MRCSEVKRRLSSRKAVGDTDIRDHLLTCPSCAREAEAAGALARIFASNRGEMPVPSLASVQKRVESRLTNQTVWEKIVNNIKDTYSARPKLALGFAATVAALLFVTLVPFSYTHTTGFQVTISVAADQPTVSPKMAEGVLAALGYDDATVELRDDKALTLSKFADAKEAYAVSMTLAQLSGSEVDAEVKPVTEVKRSPLFTQLADLVQGPKSEPIMIKFREGRLVLNGEDVDHLWSSKQASDSAVRRTLEEVLRRHLAINEDVAVSVETNDDRTSRIIKLTVSDHLSVAANRPDMSLLIADGSQHAASLDSLDDSVRSRLQVDVDAPALQGRTVLIQVELGDKED